MGRTMTTFAKLQFGFLLATVLFAASSGLSAETVKTKAVEVQVDTIATGFEHPWAVEVLPDGSYLVTERPGRLRIVRDGKLSAPIAGVPEVSARSQGGLMDVALAPDFATSRKVFLTAATRAKGGSGTEVFSATLSKDGTRL